MSVKSRRDVDCKGKTVVIREDLNAEGQRVVLRTRDSGVHILQLAAKSVSNGNDSGRGRDVFHRNFGQTSRQRYSSNHRKRRTADRDITSAKKDRKERSGGRNWKLREDGAAIFA